MRFRQKEFTEHLKQDIERKETELRRYLETWLPRYQDLFLQEYRMLEAGIEKESADYFQPGSKSFLSIAVSDDNGELIDLHTIPIWSCERLFLGVPVTQNIPGSRVAGELLDESFEEIKQELQAYIEDFIEL